MKRIFLLGDFITNTGPANANRNLYLSLSKYAILTKSIEKKKIKRIIEIIQGIILNDYIIICSFSKVNLFAIFLSKILHKKIIYYMHGCKKIEIQINPIKDNLKIEKYILNKVNFIICVSNLHKKIIIEAYPEVENKIIVHYNALNLNIYSTGSKKMKNKQINIVSFGGGMPQKNNLIICKALSTLDKNILNRIKYIVVGKDYSNKFKFKQYDFVIYKDELSHIDAINLLKNTDIYIQNSSFETFGLSVIEALLLGCSILIGNNIGAKEIINNLSTNDLIFDNNDVVEIKNKLMLLISYSNNERLKKSLAIDKIDSDIVGKKLLEKL